MAETFHFSISMISRGKSKSAVASAAYISCEKLTNEWDGVTHDYHNKKRTTSFRNLFAGEHTKRISRQKFFMEQVKLRTLLLFKKVEISFMWKCTIVKQRKEENIIRQ